MFNPANLRLFSYADACGGMSLWVYFGADEPICDTGYFDGAAKSLACGDRIMVPRVGGCLDLEVVANDGGLVRIEERKSRC